MQDVAAPQDTEARPVPSARGRGVEKCSAPDGAGTVEVDDDVGLVVAAVVDGELGEPDDEPQPADTSAAQMSKRNLGAGRTCISWSARETGWSPSHCTRVVPAAGIGAVPTTHWAALRPLGRTPPSVPRGATGYGWPE
jgi:hypothetical protein